MSNRKILKSREADFAFAGPVPANGWRCGLKLGDTTHRRALAAPPFNVNASRHDNRTLSIDVQGPAARRLQTRSYIVSTCVAHGNHGIDVWQY